MKVLEAIEVTDYIIKTQIPLLVIQLTVKVDIGEQADSDDIQVTLWITVGWL